MAPELALDGELQLDAAIVPEIGASKAPDSNALPDMPMYWYSQTWMLVTLVTSWFRDWVKQLLTVQCARVLPRPVNDLSRGCSADDIVGVVAITAVQCQNSKHKLM